MSINRRQLSTKLGWILRFYKKKYSFKSLNNFTHAHWSTWFKYNKLWKRDLGYVVGHGDSPEIKREVIITSVRKRDLDEDNLKGGAKPIPDCLKKMGWIKDDRPKFCDIRVTQRRPAKGEKLGTFIEVLTP